LRELTGAGNTHWDSLACYDNALPRDLTTSVGRSRRVDKATPLLSQGVDSCTYKFLRMKTTEEEEERKRILSLFPYSLIQVKTP